ncbi:MAG: RpiB/LacA/LacB family sugar-phosphate isomerase [Alkalispirochaetaceae bacterium]
MKVAVASDKSGFPLKQAVVEYLQTRGDVELVDYGLNSAEENEPYDAQAPKVARAIQSGEADRGIAICGTGQGMAIVANKFKGVYAVVADSIFASSKGRIINNANVLTMGGFITGPRLGVEIVQAWLDLEFTETMEERAEWLKSAFARVQVQEQENFK